MGYIIGELSIENCQLQYPTNQIYKDNKKLQYNFYVNKKLYDHLHMVKMEGIF
jgi:hypothetical protein